MKQVVFILVVAAGCASHEAPPPTVPQSPRALALAPTTDAQGCPMDLPGAKVAVTELDDGVALDFTTRGDVLELRRRVHALDDTPDATDLDNGVRVTLEPVDPRQYDDVAARAERAVFELNEGDCSSLGRGWLGLLGPNVEMKANRVPPRTPRP